MTTVPATSCTDPTDTMLMMLSLSTVAVAGRVVGVVPHVERVRGAVDDRRPRDDGDRDVEVLDLVGRRETPAAVVEVVRSSGIAAYPPPGTASVGVEPVLEDVRESRMRRGTCSSARPCRSGRAPPASGPRPPRRTPTSRSACCPRARSSIEVKYAIPTPTIVRTRRTRITETRALPRALSSFSSSAPSGVRLRSMSVDVAR